MCRIGCMCQAGRCCGSCSAPRGPLRGLLARKRACCCQPCCCFNKQQAQSAPAPVTTQNAAGEAAADTGAAQSILTN